MKVWDHIKYRDHLHRRAEELLKQPGNRRVSDRSEMKPLSPAAQRKVDMEQRLQGSMLGPRKRRKTDR